MATHGNTHDSSPGETIESVAAALRLSPNFCLPFSGIDSETPTQSLGTHELEKTPAGIGISLIGVVLLISIPR